MLRALVAVGAIVALLAAVESGVILEDVGLVSSCRTIATPPGTGGEWLACRAGRLDGRPDLTRRSCTSHGLVGAVEYWSCPFLVERGAGVRSL